MFHSIVRRSASAFPILWLVALGLILLPYRAYGLSWVDDAKANHWAGYSQSLNLEPVRETTYSADGLELVYKRYARPGAQPLLLVHGLAQNDRGWDSRLAEYSMARYLHAQGYDVWIGNLRGAGTPGFRSATPRGPHHWNIDDYAVYDVPALIQGVFTQTQQKPFFIGHSLAAWVLEGSVAGVRFDREGKLRPAPDAGARTQALIKGSVTIAGVYSLWWPFSLDSMKSNPVRSVVDYYKSNYELETLARNDLLYSIVPRLDGLPLGWIGDVLNLPFDRIPIVGSCLGNLYRGIQTELIQTPLLSMFYYPPNNDPEVVRLHAQDGLEDLGPHLIEQLANAVTSRETRSYYHRTPDEQTYRYGDVRRKPTGPALFIAGGRDRLAGAEMIYRDGYQATSSSSKDYILAERFGHLDILNGKNAYAEVWRPMVRWLRAQQ